MKSTKNIGPKRVMIKSPCDRDYYDNRNKSRNDERPVKSSAKNPVVNNKKLNDSLNTEAGNGKKRNTIGCSKSSVQQKMKSPSKINKTALFRDSRNNTITKISSNLIFTRRFSRYNDVRGKLKANKFKSTYENSGQFDETSTNYKSYVRKTPNKKNKSFLKYSTCSGVKLNEKVNKKKKRTGLCSDLPGTGTYNHRFAYDQALKLHAKGVDVDLLYKVKNKSDSIYVINGAFARTNNKQPPVSRYLNALDTSRLTKNQRTNCSKKERYKETNKDALAESQKGTKKNNDEDDALWLEELAKKRKLEEEKRKRISEIKNAKTERENKRKREELIRKQNLREAEKNLRATQLSKLLNEQNLGRKKLDTKPIVDKTENRKMEDDQMEIDRLKEEERKLIRRKLQQCLASKFKKNNVNITRSKLVGNPVKAYDECAITDVEELNAIEQWALQRDGTADTMAWLKIVTCRIDSLGKRVDNSYKNKWMRKAVDTVVDSAVEKKQLSSCSSGPLELSTQKPCNKIIKTCSSLVIKTRRTTRCPPCDHRETAAFGIQKSRKFSVCPAIENATRCQRPYGIAETDQCNYFQISGANARGLRQCCRDRCTNY